MAGQFDRDEERIVCQIYTIDYRRNARIRRVINVAYRKDILEQPHLKIEVKATK
jgi:hypothetical protein